MVDEFEMELKEFFQFWNGIQLSILEIASQLKEEDLKKTFDPALNPVGEMFYHIASTFNGWLTYQVKDGEENPGEIPTEELTVININDSLKKSFARCKRLLEKSSEKDWNKILIDYDDQNQPYEVTFGWVLWHLVEHDIHHRAQLKLQFKFLNKKVNPKVFFQSEFYTR